MAIAISKVIYTQKTEKLLFIGWKSFSLIALLTTSDDLKNSLNFQTDFSYIQSKKKGGVKKEKKLCEKCCVCVVAVSIQTVFQYFIKMYQRETGKPSLTCHFLLFVIFYGKKFCCRCSYFIYLVRKCNGSGGGGMEFMNSS